MITSNKLIGEPIIIFVTASSVDEAKVIGQSLVDKKLAACSNIITGIQSIFFWKGELCDEEEVLLIIKTERKVLELVVNEVKSLHSYEIPEIIAIPIVGGSEDYLDWMDKSINNKR